MLPSDFVAHLRNKTAAHLEAIQQSRAYKQFTSPESDTLFVVEAVKNILLETFSYGPHVTEATFTAIGRFDKKRPDLMRKAIEHDLDEVDHGEIALADFVRYGGNEQWARQRRITPESYAMAGAVRLIASHESPYAFLGYMYLFEALTPQLTSNVQNILKSRNVPNEGHVFIDMHAVEDIAHEKDLANIIEEIVKDYPDESEAIEYGFDVFSVVYPLPIWNAILDRMQGDTKQGHR